MNSKPFKYVVVPGFLRSKSDGQRHDISAQSLMHLYKVDRDECLIKYNDERDWGKDFSNLIHLYPDYHGKYEIPK